MESFANVATKLSILDACGVLNTLLFIDQKTPEYLIIQCVYKTRYFKKIISHKNNHGLTSLLSWTFPSPSQDHLKSFYHYQMTWVFFLMTKHKIKIIQKKNKWIINGAINTYFILISC